MPPRTSTGVSRNLDHSAARSVHDLKVTLRDVKPAVWRRLAIPSSYSLADLHDVLQLAMGWTNSHLYQFHSGRMRYCPPDPEDEIALDVPTRDSALIRLFEVMPYSDATLDYEYDFGDGWEHSIDVEDIRPAGEGKDDPSCVAGARACPPEDCGGFSGYESFLRAIRDPEDPDHEEFLSWYGGGFDPEAFDLARVNKLLVTYATRRRVWIRGPIPKNTGSRAYQDQRLDLLARILESRDLELERQRKDAAKRRTPRSTREAPD